MRFIILLFFLAVLNSNTYCQEIIIRGENTSRLLVWDDFTGNPDKNSSYQANTYWRLNYSFKNYTLAGDTVKLTGVAVKLELDGKQSWRKKGAETASLLRHEQGHFDIGIICQQEVIQQMNSTILLKNDFVNKLNTIFKTTLEKYHAMGVKYDEETDHSKKQEYQKKWDEFFRSKLNRP
jgi:hypothetical protein